MSKLMKRSMAVFMSITILTTGLYITHFEKKNVKAVTAVTSMEYYDGANGATQTKTDVAPVSFGTVMPRMNGAALTETSFPEYKPDIELLVKQENGTGGEWKNIDTIDYFVFNSTWGWEWQQ